MAVPKSGCLKIKNIETPVRHRGQSKSSTKSRSELIAELADIYEVIDSLIAVNQITKKEIITEQTRKHNERGGFTNKKFVETAQHPIGSFLEKYCLADPKMSL